MNKEKYIRYIEHIVDELIYDSEFEDTYRVIWTPWEADYYYDELNYYEGNYLFERYMSEHYGIKGRKELDYIWRVFSDRVEKKVGIK